VDTTEFTFGHHVRNYSGGGSGLQGFFSFGSVFGKMRVRQRSGKGGFPGCCNIGFVLAECERWFMFIILLFVVA